MATKVPLEDYLATRADEVAATEAIYSARFRLYGREDALGQELKKNAKLMRKTQARDMALFQKQKRRVGLSIVETKRLNELLARAYETTMTPEQRAITTVIARNGIIICFDTERGAASPLRLLFFYSLAHRSLGNKLRRRQFIDGEKGVVFADNLTSCSYRASRLSLDADGVTIAELIAQKTFGYISPLFKNGGSKDVIDALVDRAFHDFQDEDEADEAMEKAELDDGDAELEDDGVEPVDADAPMPGADATAELGTETTRDGVVGGGGGDDAVAPDSMDVGADAATKDGAAPVEGEAPDADATSDLRTDATRGGAPGGGDGVGAVASDQQDDRDDAATQNDAASETNWWDAGGEPPEYGSDEWTEMSYGLKQKASALVWWSGVLKALEFMPVDADITCASIDAAIREMQATPKDNFACGGPVELEAFLREAVDLGGTIFFQFHHSNKTGGALNGHGEPLFTSTTDFSSLASGLSKKDADGTIDKAAYDVGAAKLLGFMPPAEVGNLRALVKVAFPKWNDRLSYDAIEAMKRNDRFRFGTSGFSAPSVLSNAYAAHRTAAGDLIKSPALLSVAHVDAFAHLDEADYAAVRDHGADAIAALKYDDLIAALHVCIVDVAAMEDIMVIAISSVVADGFMRKPRARSS